MQESLLATHGARFHSLNGGTSPIEGGISYRLRKYIATDGKWYNVVHTFPGPSTSAGVLSFNKADTGLSTWTEIASFDAAALGVTRITDVGVDFKGDTFYISISTELNPPGTSTTIFLFTYNVLTNASAMLNSGAAGRNVSITDPATGIAVKSDGTVSIIFVGLSEIVSGSPYGRVSFIEYSGSWSSVVFVAGQAGLADNFFLGQIVCSASDRLHIFINDEADLFHVSFLAGSFGTLQDILVGGFFNFGVYPYTVGLALAYTDSGSNGRVILPYTGFDSPGDTKTIAVMSALDQTNPTWTSTILDTVFPWSTETHDYGFPYGSLVNNTRIFEQYLSAEHMTGDNVVVQFIKANYDPSYSFVVETVIYASVFNGSSWSAGVAIRTDVGAPYFIFGVWAVNNTAAFLARVDTTDFDNSHDVTDNLRHLYIAEPTPPPVTTVGYIASKGKWIQSV